MTQLCAKRAFLALFNAKKRAKLHKNNAARANLH